MEKLINFIQTQKKNIIIILIIIFIIILIIMRFIMKTNQSDSTPRPPTPSAPHQYIQYSPYPTIPPVIQPRLKYPMMFGSVTIEFKPRSGTFLVYYEGPEDIAKQDYYKYLDLLGLKPGDYSVEYRSLEPISLPPAYGQEGE